MNPNHNTYSSATRSSDNTALRIYAAITFRAIDSQNFNCVLSDKFIKLTSRPIEIWDHNFSPMLSDWLPDLYLIQMDLRLFGNAVTTYVLSLVESKLSYYRYIIFEYSNTCKY